MGRRAALSPLGQPPASVTELLLSSSPARTLSPSTASLLLPGLLDTESLDVNLPSWVLVQFLPLAPCWTKLESLWEKLIRLRSTRLLPPRPYLVRRRWIF